MKKSLKVLLTLFATAVVLVGCSVESGGGGTPPKTLIVPFAESDSADATVQAGTTELFRAQFATGFDEDVVVFDLRNVGPGVEMNIRTKNGEQIAFTNSPIFGTNRVAVQSFGTLDLDTMASVVGPAECLGYCIVLPKSVYANNTLIIDVRNSTGETVEVFAYGANYWDLNEPGNDSFNEATVVVSTEEGAFETLGDVDYWKDASSQNGTFLIEMASNLVVPRVIVYNSNGLAVHPPGNLEHAGGTSYKVEVLQNEVIALFLTGDVAAAADISKYDIMFTPFGQ